MQQVKFYFKKAVVAKSCTCGRKQKQKEDAVRKKIKQHLRQNVVVCFRACHERICFSKSLKLWKFKFSSPRH